MTVIQNNQRRSLVDLVGKLALVVCLVLLSLQALRYANPAFDEMGSDGGIYFYVGSSIANGKLPYVDVMETKPPAIFYLNALGYLLGGGTRWGLWLLEFVFLFGALAIAYLLVKKLFGPLPALMSSLLVALNLSDMLFRGDFTEEFSLLPNFLALYLFWRFRNSPTKIYFGFIGLLFSFSFLLRPNNALVPLLLVTMLVLADLFQRKWKEAFAKAAWFMLGFFILFAIVLVYFFYKGIVSNYIEAAYLYNFSYSDPTTHPSLWTSSIVPGFSILGVGVWVAVVGYIVNIYYLAVGQRTFLNFYVLFLWPIEIVLSGLGGHGFGHYFIIWLPALALLVGMAIHFFEQMLLKTFLSKYLQTSLSQAVLSCVLAFVLTFSFWGIMQRYGESFYRVLFARASGIEYVDPVSAYVRATTHPGEKVLVWGAQAKINVVSHRESPTAFIFYSLFIASPFTERYEAKYFDDLKTKRPVLIVDSYLYNPNRDTLSLDPIARQQQIRDGLGWPRTPYNLSQVLDFIANNYHLEKLIKTHDGRIAIYRLNP